MSPSDRKIRVCHLASGDLWAGAEVQVLNMCRGLLDTGHVEVSVVVLNRGRLAEELRSSGVQVTVFDEQEVAWWRILLRLADYLRRSPVDVLHTHRYKENLIGSLAAKLSGIGHVIRTVHGTTEIYSGWKMVKAGIYARIDDLVCKYLLDGLIGVSGEINRGLMRRFPRQLVSHIPNCIDDRRIVPTVIRDEKRKELGLEPWEFVIGTVGRLTPVKGTQHLIQAVPEIVRRREAVRVLVVGDGPLRSDLEALVQSLGLQKTVTFLGWRDDSIDIINSLDLFVLPSLHEGTPTVLLEAMALGVPVVASATGGIPEILTDGWSGLLTKPGSASSLAAKCLCIISDSSFGAEVVEKAKEDACKYYLNQTVAPLLTLYRRITDGITDGRGPDPFDS